MERSKVTCPIGTVNIGDFNRNVPFSTEFGYDRGGPLDRYYIERFLMDSCSFIKGRVLEIGDNEYTMKFGGKDDLKSEILHVDETNDSAKWVGDLTYAPHIPSRYFDCIILTQTLHLIYDFKKVLSTCYRILKKGGALLLTVPGITPIDYGEWEKTWYWSFTALAMQRLMAESFPGCKSEIKSYGNVRVACSFLYGMGIGELDKNSLDYNDPHFPVVITVAVIKR